MLLRGWLPPGLMAGGRVHEHLPGTRTVGVKVVRQRVGKVIADRVVVVRAVAVDSCHEVCKGVR